ncbi:MAG: polyprenol monophosphomannose synthase [Anaerolineales bacterium]|nr:polyprenol monophosphomannose synthase [Anaerolineales bacterium]
MPVKTIIVIPTYNEADNLRLITQALFDLKIPGLGILIVDDASPDGTGEIADQLAQEYPGHFDILHRTGKLGLGTAYVQGFQRAMQHGADVIVQMDADFSHSPDYIPQFLTLIKDYDVVVGSRYVKGGRLDERWSWWRWFLSWWANSVWVRIILGTRTRDATAGFKAWRASALQAIQLERIRSNGYVFQVEMCYLAEKLGLRILEIPIYFEDRRIGSSKMTVPVKIEAALRVFQIRLRHHQIKPISR